MKRICVFLSSPREGGNSDKLAEAFIKGAEASGNKVNKVVIRDCNINGCIGCEYCYSHQGRCSQQDDMQKIYQILEETDMVVFATPIYYQSFPSQLKAVVDRLYVSENKDFPICEAVLLATYATPGQEMAKQTISYFNCLIEYHKWVASGIITISGLDERDDIVGNCGLVEAYDLGKSIS